MLRQQRMKSSCNEGDLTVDVTGITGGKAGKVTAVGLEEISRNNKITFEESTFKVSSNGSRNSKKIKGEGMTGGEADEVEVVGRRTLSEVNQLTVKGSEVDMSGHAGTSGPALVIKNTIVIQNNGRVSLNQVQNVDTSKTTRGEGGDIEVTRKKMALKGDNSHNEKENVQLPCPRYPLDTKCESETDQLKKKMANVDREKEQLQMKVWKREQVELRETNLMRWLQDGDMTPSVTSGYDSARASCVSSGDSDETKRDTFDSVARNIHYQ